MTMKFTILGCGSSSGVPRITGDWGDSDPNEPKNRRQRCALLVEKIGKGGVTTIVIDTGPDFHQQMIKQNIPMIDAALITHEHADHVHGMDDLRAYAQDKKGQIDVYMTKDGRDDIDKKFGYCFHQLEGSIYPAILKQHIIDYDKSFTITGAGGAIDVKAVQLNHGRIYAAGFLINGVMYSPDVNDIPNSSQYAFHDLDIWIVDALRPQKHISHFNYDDAIAWIEKFAPKKAYLTNMTGEMDYKTVCEATKKHAQSIEVCFDGMSFEVEDL